MLPENETSEPAYVQPGSEPTYEIVQASTGKRFANYLIDLLFFYLIIFFWAIIAAILFPEAVEGLDEDGSAFGSFGDRIVSLIIYGVIMSLIEAIFRGKSIGKLITGTKAVNMDGSDISFSKAFQRGFTRIIPFEPLSAFGNPSHPWHDKWTDTYVIDEKATRSHNDLLRGW